MLRAVPVTLREANAVVARLHRHSAPVTGCRFAVGVTACGGLLVGVAICGRPLARRLDDGLTLEILRVATDGTRNACSFLYGRCRGIGRLLGYPRIITYTLEREGGASLRGAGGRLVAEVDAREWDRPTRHRRSQPAYAERKYRWEL